MKILIDQTIPGVDETFGRLGEVIRIDGRHLIQEQLLDAMVLIVRSVTTVNSSLLANTAIKFVGTTTIGTDHMDLAWLRQQGIRWASAPGCNADAAAQYSLSMMILASRRLNFNLNSCSIGIVGHGNVGSRVHRLLQAYGAKRVWVTDPPLAAAGHPGLCGMEEIADCAVITLHVPLTLSGAFATLNLVDAEFLSRLRPHTLLVNTSRGKVTEGRALQNWLDAGLGYAALDVWPDEPEIDLNLLGASTVATPHVAGHSVDGKLRGTEMIFKEFCDWKEGLQMNSETCLNPDLNYGLNPGLQSPWISVDDTILTACPVEKDDFQMRQLCDIEPESRSAFFDLLRKEYAERRDFAGWRIPTDTPAKHAKTLQTLGFY